MRKAIVDLFSDLIFNKHGLQLDLGVNFIANLGECLWIGTNSAYHRCCLWMPSQQLSKQDGRTNAIQFNYPQDFCEQMYDSHPEEFYKELYDRYRIEKIQVPS